jgi:hypothetical protein
MNSKMNRFSLNLRSLVLSLFLLVGLAACGKIPKPYRGDYLDSASGARLTLERNLGVLKMRDGRVLQSDARNLEFKDLLRGTPGIYVRPDEQNADLVEIYWFVPHWETRQSEAEFVWMESEVLYSRMDSGEKDPVQRLKMFHCQNGMLMLDLPAQNWNGGCPSERVDYEFVRSLPDYFRFDVQAL